MKKIKFIIFIILFLPGKVFSNSSNIEIIDSMKNRIVISKEVKKIISLHGSISEIICALGKAKKIIAVTDSDTYPSLLKRKIKIGKQMDPSIEQIVSLGPDLIFTSATRKSQLLFLDKLKKYNIPIVVISSVNFNDLCRNIFKIGKILSAQNEAQELVSNINNRLSNINKKLNVYYKKNPEKYIKIFYEVKSQPVLFTRGEKSIIADIIKQARIKNIVESKKSMVRYPIELLVSNNPDIYIIQKGPMNKNPINPKDNKILKDLAFVKNNQIFLVNEKLFSRPGPRSIDALELLLSYAYPGIFKKNSNFEIKQSFGKKKYSAVQKHFKNIFRLLFYIFLGVFLGIFVDSTGIIKKLYFPGKILVNYAHLPQQCITGILLSLVSSNSSNAAIRELYENKQITNKQLYFSVIISSFFSSISHFPAIFIPLVSILGWPGAAFICIRIFVSFSYMLIAIFISRKVNPKLDASDTAEKKDYKINLDLKYLFESSIKRSKKLLKKIFVIVVPMYILILLLNHYGIFNKIDILIPDVIKNILPHGSYLIIAAQFNHLLSGASIAAVMMQNHELSAKMVLIILLIGSVLSMPVRTIRHSLPGYIGILSPKKGTKLLLINQLSRTILTIIVIVFIVIFLK